MKKSNWFPFVLVLLIMIIGLVWYLLSNKKVSAPVLNDISNSLSLVKGTFSTPSSTSSVSNFSLEISKEKRIPSRYACVGEYCDGSMYGDNYKDIFTILKIPFVVEGGNIGCGVRIFYGYDTATKTSAVLDATYKRLFDIKEWPEIKEDGFRNTVAVFDRVFFDKVILEEGIAKVYFMGDIVSPGVCADPEFRAQIEAAAFQFNNIKKLEVYLNSEIFDWCTLDVSGGEGRCAEGPQYWITSK